MKRKASAVWNGGLKDGKGEANDVPVKMLTNRELRVTASGFSAYVTSVEIPSDGLKVVLSVAPRSEDVIVTTTQVETPLSMLGVSSWATTIDRERGVGKGDTEALLDGVTNRRNKIAHEGDRLGRGRASLTVTETLRVRSPSSIGGEHALAPAFGSLAHMTTLGAMKK